MKKVSKILIKGLALLGALVISVPTFASNVQGDASSFQRIFAPDEDGTISCTYP